MRITFCVVSWTVFVRVVFTDLVQTQQTRDVPAVTLLQHGECSDSRGDGHVRHTHVTIVSAPTEKKKHTVTELLKFHFHNLKSDKLYKYINKMQQYAGIYLLQNHSLHVSGVHRTLHQENIKL